MRQEAKGDNYSKSIWQMRDECHLGQSSLLRNSYVKLIEEDDSPVETFSEEMSINVILATCGRRPMRLMGSSNRKPLSDSPLYEAQ